MKTIELTDEELGTLIDALGTWMELPEEWEGEEWLRRQDRGAAIAIGVGVGWAMGLLLDFATFGLIGRLALTKALIAYIAQRFALRLRAFPVWQQACAVFLLLGMEALIITLLALMMGESDAGRPGRWVAVLMGAVLWPVIFISLRRMRRWARLP